MDILAPLITHAQSSIAVDPPKSSFDHPSMSAKALARIEHVTRDPRLDTSRLQVPFGARRTIGLVSMQLGGTSTRPAALPCHSRDRFNHLLGNRDLVGVCCRCSDHKRDSLGVDHKMALRARFAAIRRIRAGCWAPFNALTVEASRLARLQSIWSALCSRSKRTWWSRSQTPALVQSRSRRQHVIPLPNPNSWGSISHGIPVLSTNRMPLNASRFPTAGRPPFFVRGRIAGKRGSITRHSSSSRRALAIRLSCQNRQPWRVLLGVLRAKSRPNLLNMR